MKKIKLLSIPYLLGSAFLLLVASCASVRNMTIDQLYPAEATFPETISYVAVVNNMVHIPALSDKVLRKGMLYGDGKLFAEQFSAALADNAYFSQVMICDSALRAADDEQLDRLLSPREIQELSEGLGADMLLSLDGLTLNVKRESFYYPGIPEPFPMLRVDTYAVLRAYSSARSTPMMSVVLSDSLFWNLGAINSELDVVKEATSHMSALITARIAPQWKPVDRIYFDGVCAEMRDGAVLMRENSWSEAKEIWIRLYNKSKKKLKVKTAFNIALVCELEGNISEARQWLQKASKDAKDGSEEKYLIMIYSEVLQKREADVAKLNLQMNRFVK